MSEELVKSSPLKRSHVDASIEKDAEEGVTQKKGSFYFAVLEFLLIIIVVMSI